MEPLPPGLEARIQSELDAYRVHPLVGCEYIVESGQCVYAEPNYDCVLCGKEGDSQSIIIHLISVDHRMRFLEKHYYHTFRDILPYQQNLDTRHIVPKAVKFACEQIEEHYRRQPVHVRVRGESFSYILNQIERSCPYVDSYIKVDRTYMEDLLNTPDLIVFNRYPRSPPKQKLPLIHVIPTPQELYQQGDAIARDTYQREKYRVSLEMARKDIQRKFEKEMEAPERHPHYMEEWNKFWGRRHKELQRQNKDHVNYDYKPEWVSFWTNRIKQNLKDELRDIEENLRVRYNIQEGKPEAQELKQAFHLNCSEESRERVERRHRVKERERQRQIERDREYEEKRERRREAATKRRRSPSPQASSSRRKEQLPAYTRQPRPPRYPVIADYPPVYPKEPSWRPPAPVVQEQYNGPTLDYGPITMVSTLRLLAALEDNLGKEMGCRVVELLTAALSLEKVRGNASEELLTLENWQFLLRVSEKLKRSLWLREIKPLEVQACKRALEVIDTMQEKGDELEKMAKKKGEKGKVDKDALAVEVMKALRAQGKHDVSPAELNQLVLIYEKMAADAESATKVAKELAFEQLTDHDLRNLLQNFTNITEQEQSNLITFLRKLEECHPERVEKLREYMCSLGLEDSDDD